jgi:hypothetical protein
VRAALFAAALAAGCASQRGANVAAGEDPIAAAAGELLHIELAGNPEGARRVDCGDAVDCVAKLRRGAVDVAVVERDELEWLAPAGELVIAAELPIERSFALVSRPGASLGGDPRVAASRRFASRARGGLADLARAASIAPRPQIIDDPEARAAALATGAVDAAVFESWRRPAETSVVATVRGGRFVVATRPDVMARDRDRDAVGRASGAVSVRLEKLGDRIWAAIAAGVDPVDAARALAPPDRGPPPPLVLAVAPRHRDWTPAIERALAQRGIQVVGGDEPAAGDAALMLRAAGAAPIDGAELVAVFEGRELPPAELWSKTGLLDLAEARRILFASAHARLPAGDRPSAWRRLSDLKSARPHQTPRWLDTLINVAVAAFLIWLLALIVRARRA